LTRLLTEIADEEVFLKKRMKRNTCQVLFEAIEEGDAGTVAELLDSGVDRENRNEAGETPLVMAVARNRFEIVEILLRYRADREAKDVDGHTPLIVAVSKGYNYIVGTLLRYGANAEGSDDDGDTPLVVANRCGNANAAIMLLGSGARARAFPMRITVTVGAN